MVKRGVDILLSAALLLLVSPLLVLSAALIAITSPGPVLFRQVRIGQHFKPFTLYKLRTMVHNAPGLDYTLGNDSRITRLGHWLRSTKIDELPQLWNVLRGEMSLVGPRPVIPSLTEEFQTHYSLLLRARPGLTDPASLKYRRETEILKLATDQESFFKYVVTPDKINISRNYMEIATPWTDLGLLCMTALICVVPALSRLFGQIPQPPRKPVYPDAPAPAALAEPAPVWMQADISLLPQPSDYRLIEDLAEFNPLAPWNLLADTKFVAQSSINSANRGASRL